MTDIVKQQETQVASSDGEANAFLLMIERVARDSSVDIERLERLLDMQERIVTRNAKVAYIDSLSRMQPELPEIEERGAIKTSGGGVQSKYALWEDINKVIKPILRDHGFSLTFKVSSEDKMINVTGILSHNQGHSEETTISLPVDNSGSKNSVQSVGSSTSYGQRYTAKLLLNITSRGADDDGKSAPLGSTCQEAIRAINLCADAEALKSWHGKNWEGLSSMLNDREKDEIVALFNRRRKSLRVSQNDK